MTPSRPGDESSTSRREVLRASGAAALGAATFFGANTIGLALGGTPDASAATGGDATPAASQRQFNVVDYGADPKGVADASHAVAEAQADLKAAGGGDLFFPPGGVYRFSTGIVSRTRLADARMSITAADAILRPFGSGIGITTEMTDPAYWTQPLLPPMAPVVWGVLDCSHLTSGGIGCRHSIARGAYYDGAVWNAAAGPSAHWPTTGSDGARGFQVRNTRDQNGAPKPTELTVFGPRFSVENCYIGLEFDAANGASSFEFTTMLRHAIECNTVGQRGVVVRGSGTVPAAVLNADFTWQGQSHDPHHSGTVGTVSTALTPGDSYVAVPLAHGTPVALYDGQIIVIIDQAGTGSQAVMVRGRNPVGTSLVSTYQFRCAVTTVGATVKLVPATCVVGWPGPGAPGWSAGTATDASSVSGATVDWHTDTGGGPVATCTLFVSPTATWESVGQLDNASATSAVIQNYGTFQALGAIDGVLVGATNATADDASTQLATDEFVQKAVAAVVRQFGRFNVVAYGADPSGATNSTAAVAAAQADLKAAGGGLLVFPPGTYLIDAGTLTRRTLADANFGLDASQATLVHSATSGILLDTMITDPDYWAVPSTTPQLAPWVWKRIDGTNALTGSVGVRCSNYVGAFHDGQIVYYNATPDPTWPTSGSPGNVGLLMQNNLDDNGTARWTERSVFGPNLSLEYNYIGLELDANGTTKSFGYTRFLRAVFDNLVGQRMVVIRNSSPGNVTHLYSSDITWLGNLGGEGTTTTFGTMTDTIVTGNTYSQLGYSYGLRQALYDGQIVILKDSTGANPQAVMVRGNNPVGATTLLTYAFTASVTYTGGTVQIVNTGVVVGWPSPSATGWGAGTATDASEFITSTMTWMMEGNSKNSDVNTCPLYISPTAKFSATGHIDVAYDSSGLIQNYGSLDFIGPYNGLLSAGSQRVTAVAPGVSPTDAATTGQLPAQWSPANQGLAAWTMDLGLATATATVPTMTVGTVYLFGLSLPAQTTLVGDAFYSVDAGGTDLGQCYVGLYNAAGTLLAASTDQSSNWESSGFVASPTTLTPVPGQSLAALAPGTYYLALLVGNAGNVPSFAGSTCLSPAALNAGASATSLAGGVRSGSSGAGLTALPLTISGSIAEFSGVLAAAIS